MSFEAPTQQVTQDRPWDLFDSVATRLLEQRPVEGHSSLMQRAGIASAKLALALAPHARCIWIACGPGNNGGDGFQAAAALAAWGKNVVVTKVADDTSYGEDAQLALHAARASGARFADQPPDAFDLGIDAMFGIGTSRPMAAPYDRWASVLNEGSQMTLALDVPSGLHPDTGSAQQVRVRAQHTLCLLTLKPGLFTGYGRDAAGTVWFNSLGMTPGTPPTAQLAGRRPRRCAPMPATKAPMAMCW